jgi:hypothetical protein
LLPADIFRMSGSTASRTIRPTGPAALLLLMRAGGLDDALDSGAPQPVEQGESLLVVGHVAQAPGKHDGVLYRQRGALTGAG